jgi:hypothetical protein
MKHLAIGICRCPQIFTLWMSMFDDSIKEKTEGIASIFRRRNTTGLTPTMAK